MAENNVGDTKLLFEPVAIKTQLVKVDCFVYPQELENVFGLWPQLLLLDLSGNPVCKKPKYRDRLITLCTSLGNAPSLFLHINI